MANRNDTVSREYLKDRMDDLINLHEFPAGGWNDAVQACMREVDTAPSADEAWKVQAIDKLSTASGGIMGIADAIETTRGGIVTAKTVELLRGYASNIDDVLKVIMAREEDQSDD